MRSGSLVVLGEECCTRWDEVIPKAAAKAQVPRGHRRRARRPATLLQ